MSFINCFDAASMVIDEANTRFYPQYRENREKKKILQEYCEALDNLAQEFNGTSFTVEIDEEVKTIAITMVCPDIVIKSKEHRLYDLIERSSKVLFSTDENGDLTVTFVFPSIWYLVT